MLSIGCYESLETPTIGSEIWIQSIRAKQHDIWYQLGQPSPEYKRYHQPFLWVANFAKYVVDFLCTHPMTHLINFRAQFANWLFKTHGQNKHVIVWSQQMPNRNFCGALIVYANFLYCQAAQVSQVHAEQPLWSEIDPRALNAVHEQIEIGFTDDMTTTIDAGEQSYKQRKTTVTPFVAKCFAHMPWARLLYSSTARAPSSPAATFEGVFSLEESKSQQLMAERDRNDCHTPKSTSLRRPIEVGDVVAIERDESSDWRTEDGDYFAYVQDVNVSPSGRCLGLLWFYRPGDTACKNMHYPFKKELFLSDHCNCGDAAVYERDVMTLPRVAFFGGPEPRNCDFFCRQQYEEGDAAWRTLEKSHFQCQCRKPPQDAEFQARDTVLIKEKSKSGRVILEPTVLVEYLLIDSGTRVKVRRLSRRGRDYGCARASPNELVFTHHCDVIHISDIERRCQVGCFTEYESRENRIPHPFNKRGMGDFFITSREYSEGLETLQDEVDVCRLKSMFTSYPRPSEPKILPRETSRYRLRGLDIFCGGGNFARGVEEGGAVDFEWAVDYCSEAIHTYKANLDEGKTTKLFRGSVNHYLSQAIAGSGVGLVAQQGEVDMLISGSPCQGFSAMNPHRGVHDRGLLNESLVASSISYIDFYRPKYALLENVPGIASVRGETNVLSQVLCALVGMGYQVQVFVLDAWNFSSPQSRSRVFISCAAAGLQPLEEPPHTHSHSGRMMGSSLGKTANGLTFGARYENPTPFEYVKAEEALEDLPPTDGRICSIPFPDHRTSIQLSILDRIRLESVPRHPPGMSFMKAVQRGYMPQPQIDKFSWHSAVRAKENSRCWQRIQKTSLIPTITTTPRPSDGLAGNCVHWEQHRVLTIMEARRAQGIHDDEVLVGEKAAQYKIVGNSVARPVAFAWGLSLQKAVLANSKKQAAFPIREPERTPTTVMRADMNSSDQNVGSKAIIQVRIDLVRK